MSDLKTIIKQCLQRFQTLELRTAALALLNALGYASDKTMELDGSRGAFLEQFNQNPEATRFNEEKALSKDWKNIQLLFQLTDQELSGQIDLFQDNAVKQSLMTSYLFFAVALSGEDYARGKLAQIARQINRLFPMPVMVLFVYNAKLSIAVINRRRNKRDEEKDVLGKVTLIQDINLENPHRGHLDILASFALPELAGKGGIHSFDALHAAWEEVFNVELLNKKFYRELSNWYFWAMQQVRFPYDQLEYEKSQLDKGDLFKDKAALREHDAKNLIRLLTRLLFVWFIKEKGLVPDALFEREALEKELLKTFDADSKETHYYKAILQNLFFATLNQTQGKRQFRKAGQHRNTTTLMRYKSSFQCPEKFIQTLEEIVPFMNGGLFECLDKPHPTLKGRQGGDVILYEDGFSDRKDNALEVPDFLFFGKERVIDLSDVYGDKKRKKETVRGIISILNSYKFTIVENTPIEQEIALDPELLGKVFENLLASYNPETKTTARKQTGSFYTPRTIVDYMVDESLKAYLQKSLTTEYTEHTERGIGRKNAQKSQKEDSRPFASIRGSKKPSSQSSVSSVSSVVKNSPLMSEEDAKEGLEILFSYTEKEHAFTNAEKHALIQAIDSCKILDPACGSGAFPMGILHKLEFILGKLDPDNALWRDRQIAKVDATIAAAEQIDDASIRDNTIRELEAQKKDIEESFANNELGYGRKLYLIENCIYGVDIQSIATQVSKLRFFISLIVDQKVSRVPQASSLPKNVPQASCLPESNPKQGRLEACDTKKDSRSFVSIRGSNPGDNFGIRPLPNLEIKFATANTLIQIEKPKNQGELFDSKKVQTLEKELKKVRHNLFSAKTPATKRKHRQRDKELREEIASELEANGWSNASARQLAGWDPYDQNASSPFFDPEWMFDLPGFDIVIGNPPYISVEKFSGTTVQNKWKETYSTYAARGDIYCFFYERGTQLLKQGGHLFYITSNKWMRAGYGKGLRDFFSNKVDAQQVLDFGMAQNFGAATTYTNILGFENSNPRKQTRCCYASDVRSAMADPETYFNQNAVVMPELDENAWVVCSPERHKLKQVVEAQGIPLEDWKLKINYGVKTGFNDAFYLTQKQRDELIAKEPQSEDIIVPLLRGRHVGRYEVNFDNQYMLVVKFGAYKTLETEYPAVYSHLKQFEEKLKKRGQCKYSRAKKAGANQDYPGQHHWLELDNNPTDEYINSFRKPKIIYPNMTKYLPFYYDESDHFFINDKAFIMTSESESLPYLTAVLNSSLFKCCFRDNFPELMGNTYEVRKVFVDKIPIRKPQPGEAELFEKLVPMVQLAKHEGLDVPAAFLEELIDACVLELYFLDEAAAKNLLFINQVAALLGGAHAVRPGGEASAPPAVKDIETFVAAANTPTHPIRTQLARIESDSPDLFAVIKQEGRV